MHIQPEMQLQEIASSCHAARRALEGAGLDYCCDGSHTLAEACAAAGVELGRLEAQLRDVEAGAEGDQAQRELAAVLESILVELHPRARRLLAEAAEGASAFAEKQPHTRPLAEAVIALASRATHQMREEDTLYSRVRALADARMGLGPYPTPPFRTIHEHGDELRDGHRRTHDRIRLVRAHLAAFDGPGTEDVRGRVDAALTALVEQMHVENNELLPRARELEPNGDVAAH
jgi:regulator of cell morphogenesis and NO signaling